MLARVWPLCLLLVALPCGRAAAQQFNGFPLLVKPMGDAVNTPADEYAPAVTDRGTTLFFTTTREAEGKGAADVFLTRWIAKTWFQAVNAGDVLNTPEDEGTLAFTADENTVVFASDARPDGFGKTDLYIGKVVNGRPAEVRNLGPNVNSSSWDSHPTISGDGTLLIFSTNRPGGYGGLDLWMSRKDSSGQWGRAFPLSGLVNTTGDECSPFLAADNRTLYFASNGLNGYGGYDLWVTSLDDGTWRQPVNLGPTMNSPQDDLFLSTEPSAMAAYFATARPGGSGGLDIWSCTPNIFASGVACITLTTVDTLRSELVNALVSVKDALSGTVVETTQSAPGGTAELWMPIGRTLVIEAWIPGGKHVSAKITLDAQRPRVQMRLGLIPPAGVQYPGRNAVPLYIPGYYKPATTQGLEQMQEELDGPLAQASYIARFSRRKKGGELARIWAAAAESECRRVWIGAADAAFPRALQSPSSRVIIEVTGYPDPQPFTGVCYERDEISYLDASDARRTVHRGDTLTAEALAGMRAWHTADLFDRLFSAGASRGKAHYTQLKLSGRIEWRHRAVAIADIVNDPSARRRFRLVVREVAPNGPEGGTVLYDSGTALGQ